MILFCYPPGLNQHILLVCFRMKGCCFRTRSSRCCFELVVFNYTGGCFEDLWFWTRNLLVSWLTWLHIFWKWGDVENHQQVKCLRIPIWQLHYITCQKINSSQSQTGGCFFASNLNFQFTSVEGLQGCPVIWPFGEDLFKENTTERGDKDVSVMSFCWCCW